MTFGNDLNLDTGSVLFDLVVSICPFGLEISLDTTKTLCLYGGVFHIPY